MEKLKMEIVLLSDNIGEYGLHTKNVVSILKLFVLGNRIQ